MSHENRKRRWNVWFVISILSLVFCGGMTLTAFSSGSFGRDFSGLASLKQQVQELRAAMNTDSVRLSSIRKAMATISEHSPDMPSSHRYEIASVIYEMSIKHTNLDVDLICAVITHESART